MSENTIASVVHQTKFRLTIPNITELKEFTSPEFAAGGVPWKIQVRKTDDAPTFNIELICAQSSVISVLQYAAYFSFKLLSFDNYDDEEECHSTPMTFDIADRSFIYTDFINWDDIIDAEKNFLKDGKICLEIKVNVADPNELSRSKLTIETSKQCCTNSESATLQLRVSNVNNLMAVQAPEITLQGCVWILTVYRNHESYLGVCLRPGLSDKDATFDTEMTAKLITPKMLRTRFEKTREETMTYKDYCCSLLIEELISWPELFIPRNGFIQDNSMTLQVNIKITKSEDSDAFESTPQRPGMGCPICFKKFGEQSVSCTPCGHTFCSDCIERAAHDRSSCPTCNRAITLTGLRRVFLAILP